MFDFFKSHAWSLEGLTPPWGNDVSIYIYIRDNPKATDLPDEPRPRKPNKLSWSPGALDGVLGHHMASAKTEEVGRRVQKLFAALKRLLKEATDANLKALYDAILEQSILPIADAFQSELSKILPLHSAKLAQLGRYFAAGAGRREATKFGILLLEVAGNRTDSLLLETLALNDEFTLFAALALAHVTNDPAQTSWNIAKRVRGWGRIQVVERLNGTRNPEIQAWMLREGFRNEVMDSYLAGICARTGNLHLALDVKNIDRQLLDGAAGIIRALLEGGPADSIDDYEYAAATIERYLGHVLKIDDLDLEHFLCVSEILQFLSGNEGWESRFSKGWTAELRGRRRLTPSPNSFPGQHLLIYWTILLIRAINVREVHSPPRSSFPFWHRVSGRPERRRRERPPPAQGSLLHRSAPTASSRSHPRRLPPIPGPPLQL